MPRVREEAWGRRGEWRLRAARENGVAPSSVVRFILIAIGVVCVGVGIAGVFIPLLPTTPFLLLAAACFTRSSSKLYHWLTTNRWVGDYVRGYLEHRATTVPAKVWSIVTLLCALASVAAFFTESWIVRSVLLLIGVGVTAHLLSLRTITRQATPAPFWKRTSRRTEHSSREEEQANDEPRESGRQQPDLGRGLKGA